MSELVTLRERLADVWNQQVRHQHCGETPEQHVNQFVEAVVAWLDSAAITDDGGDLITVVADLAQKAAR
jgi:hypothetical protein